MKKTMIRFAAALLMTAGTASAAIVVENMAGDIFDSASGSASISYTLQNSGNVLVLGTFVDGDGIVSNPSYGGSAGDYATTVNRLSLMYFLDPAETGNITFDVAGGNGNSAYYLYELSGVDTSAAVSHGSGASITTGSNAEFVVDFLGINNGPADSATASPFSTSIVDYDGWADANSAIGGCSIGAGSGIAGAAGSQQLGWNGGWQYGELSAGFTAIPEPATIGLVGFFGAGVLFIRRRMMM